MSPKGILFFLSNTPSTSSTAQIVKRYLTRRPRLIAARELKSLVDNLAVKRKEDFEDEYRRWKARWNEMLNRRSTLRSGKTQFMIRAE